MLRSFHCWVTVSAIVLASCQTATNVGPDMIRLHGQTMGTTFEIAYVDSQDRVFDTAIDSLLVVVNNSMSTYIPNSTISTFNKLADTSLFPIDYHFYTVYLLSKDIYRITDGAFNPAVMPLVNFWGFGPEDHPPHVDSAVVDSLLTITDFGKVRGAKVEVDGETRYYLQKLDPRIQLDFSAIAKGYGVDVLFRYLMDQQLAHVYVEIGGEIVVSAGEGMSPWVIGIEDPINSKVEDRKALAYLSMNNGSVATSGNYRNIRVIDGIKYTHSIDPATGFPAQNKTLSASIIAQQCAVADALATACMVASPEAALQFVQAAACEGLLIVSNDAGGEDTLQTPGFNEWLKGEE